MRGGRGHTDRAQRVPAHLRVRYAGHELTFQSNAYDLSTSGLFIETGTPEPPGTEASVTMHSYLAPDPLLATCVVARTGSQPTQGMGLRFTAIDPRTQRAVERYCSQFVDEPRAVMVDDDPALLRMMARFLERAGISFVGIDLPIRTERILERLQPHVVILDVMMPEVCGVSVARRLLSNPATADIPIMFYSASPSSEIPSDLAHLPFVEKGAPRELVIAHIEQHMRKYASAPAHDHGPGLD